MFLLGVHTSLATNTAMGHAVDHLDRRHQGSLLHLPLQHPGCRYALGHVVVIVKEHLSGDAEQR